jgi:hypothetical protein
VVNETTWTSFTSTQLPATTAKRSWTELWLGKQSPPQSVNACQIQSSPAPMTAPKSPGVSHPLALATLGSSSPNPSSRLPRVAQHRRGESGWGNASCRRGDTSPNYTATPRQNVPPRSLTNQVTRQRTGPGELASARCKFLGESDEKVFGPADVAEPIRVFVLDHFTTDQLRAVLAEPGERLVDVVHREHDA